MSFQLLKKIINDLKKSEKCPFCTSGFDENLIFVLATSADPSTMSYNGLLLIVCPQCNCQLFGLIEARNITANLRSNQLKKEFIKIQTKPVPHGINTNDILDMHNFLKTWKGDVKELF